MKLAHNIRLSVFAHDEEDPAALADCLTGLVPLDFEKEKLDLKKSLAEGFNQKRIVIFEVFLEKQSHVSKFLSYLLSNLSREQKDLLSRQAESRLDSELNFFLRLDKDRLLKDKVFQITDSGNCFHIRIQIAAFPAKRDEALKVVRQLFS